MIAILHIVVLLLSVCVLCVIRLVVLVVVVVASPVLLDMCIIMCVSSYSIFINRTTMVITHMLCIYRCVWVGLMFRLSLLFGYASLAVFVRLCVTVLVFALHHQRTKPLVLMGVSLLAHMIVLLLA